MKKLIIVVGLFCFLVSCTPATETKQTDSKMACEVDELVEQLDILQTSYDTIKKAQSEISDSYESLLNEYNALRDELTVVEDSSVVRNQILQNTISSLKIELIEMKTKLNEFEYIYDLVQVEVSSTEIEDIPFEEREILVVDNGVDLLNAIGSNKHIVIKAGDYNLSNISMREVDNPNVTWASVYDGNEIIVTNIHNLRLEGESDALVSLMVEPRYADVFEFQYCQNIEFYNLRMGHTLDKGECAGGVIAMYDCINFGFENTILYGCGTYGLVGSNVVGVNFNNSVIEECTYGIVSIYSSSDLTFTNSIFRDNVGFDMFYIGGSSNVVIDNCEFLNNTSDYGPLLALYGTYDAVVKNSLIKGNSGPAFRSGDTEISIEATEIENNFFAAEIYQLYD